jgi:hypothetical protein
MVKGVCNTGTYPQILIDFECPGLGAINTKKSKKRR